MRKLQTDKRGSFFDNMSVFIWIVVITLIMALCMFVLTQLNTSFSTSGLPTESTTQFSGFTTKFNGLADGSIVLWLIILWIGTILTSFFLDSYPVFFVVFTVLSVLSFFILAPIANVAVLFLEDSTFASVLAQLPLTSFILNHLLIFNAIFIITTGVVLYAKFKR